MKKILIIDYYYEDYLKKIQSELVDKENLEAYSNLKLSKNFSAANFNASSLRKLGFDAETFPANDMLFHKLWLKSKGIKSASPMLDFALQLPYFRYKYRKMWHQSVVRKKIIETKPDILFIQVPSFFPGRFFKGLKQYYGKAIAHISSRMPPKDHFDPYDLIVTSFPHYVEAFRSFGKRAEYIPLAFDQSVWDLIGDTDRDIDVSFVGSFLKTHERENKILEKLADKIRLDVWGHGVNILSNNSPIHKHYHSEAWGNEMYRILGRSKITINRHPKAFAKDYANNMRLYESTGMGALLITDNKKNIGDLFDVGKEIVVYNSIDDLVEKVKYYQNHDSEREEIAKAGQRKTLSEHTYDARMKKLADLLI